MKHDLPRLKAVWAAALKGKRARLVFRLIAHPGFADLVAEAARPPFHSCLTALAQEGTAAYMAAALAVCNPFRASDQELGRRTHERALAVAVEGGAWDTARLLVDAGASWRQCAAGSTVLGNVLAAPEGPSVDALLGALRAAGAHPFWSPETGATSVVGECARTDNPAPIARWHRLGGPVAADPDSGQSLLHAWANPDFGWGGFLTRMVVAPPYACWAWAESHGIGWEARDRRGVCALDALRRWPHPEAVAAVRSLELTAALPLAAASPSGTDQRLPRTRL